MKPTKKEIKEIKEFANRGASSTINAMHKQCLRNALKAKDYNDTNIQSFVRDMRKG